MRLLAGRLTYANVMATIAVFIALGTGAYAAVNLPKNSVTSKQIKNGQVKPPDLASNVRSRPFSYTAPMNTVAQTTVLNQAGYKILASCPEVAGEPNLQAAIVVPKSGSIDSLQAQTLDGTEPTPGLGRFPVTGGEPRSITGPPGQFVPVSGEVAVVSGVLTYTAPGRTALISITIRANDLDERCEISGGLIPTG